QSAITVPDLSRNILHLHQMNDGSDHLFECRGPSKSVIAPSSLAGVGSLGKFRILPAWPEQIHANIIFAKFQGCGFDQPELPGFGGGIGRLPGRSLISSIGPDDDNRSAALPTQRRDHGAQTVKESCEVGGHHFRPVVLLKPEHKFAAADASRAHKREGRRVVLRKRIDHLLDRASMAHICFIERPSATGSVYFPQNLFRRGFALVIVDANTPAGAPKRTAYCSTDSAGRPGHQDRAWSGCGGRHVRLL